MTLRPLAAEALESGSASGGPLALPAVAAVLIAMALVVLDASMANAALPSMARSFGVDPAGAILVVTAYQAALIMLLLPCGALGERLGYRRVFSAGVATFTAASVLCAATPSLGLLLAARFLQGVGGAAVLALGIPLLRLSVPRRRFGAAVGWNALTVALASAAGPGLGALIVSGASWPWLFLVNLPLGCAALFAGRALPADGGSARTIDLLSMTLNAVGFGALVLSAEFMPTAPVVGAGLLAAAGLGLSALFMRDKARPAPVVPFDLLRAPPFRISVIASVCCFTGQTAALVTLPFHLQHGFGRSPLATGLYMTAWPLAVAAAAMVSGRLADRISTAWLCALGGALLAIGSASIALWPQARGPGALVVFVAVCGLGFGLFQTPNNRSMFLSAPAERSGAAGGLQGAARLTGQTAGAVVAAQLFAGASMETAPRIAFGLAALLTLTAGLVSLLRAQLTPASRGSA